MDVREGNDAVEGELKSEAVIEKVRKLMSLAQNDNENEAALATLRANQLILKHNLDAQAADREGDAEYCVDLVLACRRSSPRSFAISHILREFLVFPVFTSVGLEVTGSRANVENSRYIADYLDRELRALWKAARALALSLLHRFFPHVVNPLFRFDARDRHGEGQARAVRRAVCRLRGRLAAHPRSRGDGGPAARERVIRAPRLEHEIAWKGSGRAVRSRFPHFRTSQGLRTGRLPAAGIGRLRAGCSLEQGRGRPDAAHRQEDYHPFHDAKRVFVWLPVANAEDLDKITDTAW